MHEYGFSTNEPSVGLNPFITNDPCRPHFLQPAKQSAADIFSGATPSNILWDETEVAEYEEAESYEGPDTVDVKKSLDFDTTTVLGFNLLDEGLHLTVGMLLFQFSHWWRHTVIVVWQHLQCHT